MDLVMASVGEEAGAEAAEEDGEGDSAVGHGVGHSTEVIILTTAAIPTTPATGLLLPITLIQLSLQPNPRKNRG